MIAIRIQPPSWKVIEAFRDWATSLPETLGVFVTTDNEDFIIRVAVPDNNNLYAFVIDKLMQRPEVADARTSVVYENIRNSHVVPLV